MNQPREWLPPYRPQPAEQGENRNDQHTKNGRRAGGALARRSPHAAATTTTGSSADAGGRRRRGRRSRRRSATASRPTDRRTIGAAGSGRLDCAVDEVDGDLALYNWAEYIDPDLLTAFEDQYGVGVTQDTYDSNEAMQPIISAGNSGYDVIVPSDYMVSILIENGDLLPLNKAAIPNYANLADEFASGLPYDPDGAYAAPYQWGTTGLGVDKAVTGEDFPRSWALVFDQATAEQYGAAGRDHAAQRPP